MGPVVFVRLAFLLMPTAVAVQLLTASNSSNPWMLYANINPCDGGNMGYGASAWYGSAGSAATSLTNDFVDGTVGTAPVKYVTIARHAGGACEMSKTWELTSSTKSMYDYFSDHSPGRIYATGDGSASDTHIASDMPSSFSGDGTPGDPIFGADGGLVFNWWYSNNGARVAVPGGYKTPYSLPGTGENNDDLHGLGNEFGANTQAGGGSGSWWHDAAKIMGDCHGTSCQVLGSDHGSAWGSTNFGCWGSYAIYVSAALSTFPCQGSTLSAQVSGAAAGGAGGAAAVGDPHLQNVHGERFDLMKPGKHVLINIPRGAGAESALLRVQADARQLGGQCADMYFQELNVTGSWAEAKKVGGYHFSVSQDGDVATSEWVAFGKVGLKVVHGRTGSGLSYLNVYMKHLGRAGFAVGGLLGEDDHTGVVTPPEACANRLAL
ncbi:unnamed protein product [Prorocentrum cordatum]|uniref:Uncharacterized protein n=1 Tax=Prorocentrum cordatum TaxID=2364126 RepID=A0ABN9XX31_9DINO|nr:unnamed protein product [Polarella glacialis]